MRTLPYDRGAAGVVLAAVVALALLLGIAVGDIGRYLAAVSAADTAADAVALAAAPVTFASYGATGSAREEARRFAVANGARLVSCRCPQNPGFGRREIVVTVERSIRLVLFGERFVRATGRAEFIPPRPVVAPPPGPEAPR